MRIVTPDQNSAEWLREKCGVISASRMADATSFLKRGEKKGAESEKRHRYKRDLAIERITGITTPHYVSPDMDFGSAFEAAARAEYQLLTGREVRRVGFVLHPNFDFAGASPDGLIDADKGCVEFKVPRLDTHLDWLEDEVVPEEHVPQCDFVTCCAEYDWCDFVSYSPAVDDEYMHPSVRDPRRLVLPEKMRLFVVRIPRDEKRIAALEFAAVQLNGEVDELAAKFRGETFKEQLRKSVELDPDMHITDSDLPQWARDMQTK
jgi:hypothetical protein